MATAAELDTQRGWAEQVRIAASWQTSEERVTKLDDLANEIDPDVKVAEPDLPTPPVELSDLF